MADELEIKVSAMPDVSNAAAGRFCRALSEALGSLPENKLPKIAVALDIARTKQLLKKQLAELADSLTVTAKTNAGQTNKSGGKTETGTQAEKRMQAELDKTARKQEANAQRQKSVQAQAAKQLASFLEYQRKLKPLTFVEPQQVQAIKEITGGLQKAAVTGNKTAYADAMNDIKRFQAEMKTAGNENRNVWNHLDAKVRSFGSYLVGSGLVLSFVSQLRQGVDTAVLLNTALTTINETMPVTKSGLVEIGDKSLKMAQDLGTSAANVLSVAQIYANLNETVDNMLEKSKPTLYLSNASGLSGSEAADTIQASLIQFDLAEQEAMRVTDVFETVSANMKMEFGRGIQEITEGIQTSGSVAVEAGYDLERYAAMLGSVIEATRFDGSRVGNAYKMIFARLGGAKSDDVTAEDVSDTEKAYKTIGISLRDVNGEFRKTEAVLDDLYAKWDSLNSVQRSYIAEASAGNRQRSIFLAMMENYGRQAEITAAALSSEGFAEEVQAKHMESIAAKSETLRASLAEMVNNFVGGGLLEFLADAGNGVFTLLNLFGSLPAKILSVTALLPMLTGLLNTLQKTSLGLNITESFGKLTKWGGDALALISLIMEKGVGLKALGALNITPSFKAGLIIAGITAVIAAYQLYQKHIQETIDRAHELEQKHNEQVAAIKNNKQTLEGLRGEFAALSKGVDEYGNNISLSTEEYQRYKAIVEQIVGISPELAEGYDAEGNAIARKTGLLDKAISAQEKLYQLQLKQQTAPDVVEEQYKGYQNEYVRKLQELGKIKQTLRQAATGIDPKDIADITGVSAADLNDHDRMMYFYNNAGAIVSNIEQVIQAAGLDEQEDAAVIAQLRSVSEEYRNANAEAEKLSGNMRSVYQTTAMAADGYNDLTEQQKGVITNWINTADKFSISKMLHMSKTERSKLGNDISYVVEAFTRLSDSGVSALEKLSGAGDSLKNGDITVKEYAGAIDGAAAQLADLVRGDRKLKKALGLSGVPDENLAAELKIKLGIDTGETLGNLKKEFAKISGEFSGSFGVFENLTFPALSRLNEYLQSFPGDTEMQRQALENLKRELEGLSGDDMAQLSRVLGRAFDETSAASVQSYNSAIHEFFAGLTNENGSVRYTAEQVHFLTQAFAAGSGKVQSAADQFQDAVNSVNEYAKAIETLSSAYSALVKGEQVDFDSIMGLLADSPELAAALEVENGVLKINQESIGRLMVLKEQQFKQDLLLKQMEAEATQANLMVKLEAIQAEMESRKLLADVTAQTASLSLQAGAADASGAADWASYTMQAQGGVVSGWLNVGEAAAWAHGLSNSQLVMQRNLINQSIKNIQNTITGIKKLSGVNIPKSLAMGGGSAKSAEDYGKKVKKINDDLAKKEEETAKKIAELDKKARLDNLKNSIEAAKLELTQFRNIIEDLDLKLELTFDGDFASKMDILSAKFETAEERGKRLRQEFERLAGTEPQTADEAKELASEMDALGSELRSNLKDVVNAKNEIDRLRVSAAAAAADNAVGALKNEIALLDYDRQVLTQGSLFGPAAAFSFDYLLPEIPESQADKKRAENDALLAEEARYRDEINRITAESLRLQAEENARAREEERQNLIASLEEARRKAADNLKALAKDGAKSAEAVGAAFDKISAKYRHSIKDLTNTYLKDLDGTARTQYETLLTSLQMNYLDPSSAAYDSWLDDNLEKIVEKSGEAEFRENFSTILGIQSTFFDTWSLNDQKEFPALAREITDYLLNPTEGAARQTYNKNLIEIFRRYCTTSDEEQAKKYAADIIKLSGHNTEVETSINNMLDEIGKKTIPTPEAKTEDWKAQGVEAGKAFREGLQSIPIKITGFFEGLFGSDGQGGGDNGATSVSEYYGAKINSPYGWRVHPIDKTRKFHAGTDVGLPNGSPVKAPVGGKVTLAGVNGGYGNCVIITTATGEQELFGHLSKILVSKGQTVGANSVVGLVGSTGKSTGPHLHFEVRTPGGSATSPDAFMRRREAGGTVGRGELTLVGEKNRELGILPNGRVVLLGKDHAELVDLPVGTKVIPNRETEEILKYTGASVLNRPIPKLADGNVDVTVNSADNPDAVNVTADEVTVDTKETTIEEAKLSDWLRRYTQIPQAYTKEFMLAYRSYANSRRENLSRIEGIKESDPALAKKLTDEQLLSDIYKTGQMQQDAYFATAQKLAKAYNDLLWEYNQVEDSADPAVLEEYVEGLAKIQQQMRDLDADWLKSSEAIAKTIESTFALLSQPLDLKTGALERELASLEHTLSLTTDFQESMNLMARISEFAQEKADAAYGKRDLAHSLAESLRKENEYITSLFDTESWFDAEGGLTLSFQADMASIDAADTELRGKVQTFAAALGVYKKSWADADKARMDAEKAVYDYAKQRVEKQTEAYNRMYDKVLDMIERNYQQEKKMADAAHETRMKELDDEKQAIEDIYSRRLELLEDIKSGGDYQKSLAKEQETADKLQARIDLLALDSSDSARTQRLVLEKQLAEQKDKIAQMQRDHEFEETKKALQKDKELQDKHIEELKEAENDYFERLAEELEKRYAQENRYNMATEALATGTLRVISAEGIKTYADIATQGKGTAMSLQSAYDILAAESGEKFRGMGVEFSNLTNLFREAIDLSEQLAASGAFAWLKGQNEFTPSTDVTGGRPLAKPENGAYDITNWTTGNSGDEALTGRTQEENEELLRRSAGFRAEELNRAMVVIENRMMQGLDTQAQKRYLKHVIDLIRSSGDAITGVNLSAIVSRYGLMSYHGGKAEQLAVILDSEAVLTKKQQDVILGRFRDLTRFTAGVAEQVQRQMKTMQTGTPRTALSIGDVNINVSGNADSQTVRALKTGGVKLREALGTELRRYLGEK